MLVSKSHHTHQKPSTKSKFDPIIEEEEEKHEKSKVKYQKIGNESFEGGEEEESKHMINSPKSTVNQSEIFLESMDDIDPLSNWELLQQFTKERFMSELNKIDIEKALESSDTSSGTFES